MIIIDEILVMQRYRRGEQPDTEEVHLLLVNEEGECMPAVVSMKAEEVATLVAWYKQPTPAPAPASTADDSEDSAPLGGLFVDYEDSAPQGRPRTRTSDAPSIPVRLLEAHEDDPFDADAERGEGEVLVASDPTAPLEFNPLAVVPRALRTERPRILRPSSTPATTPDNPSSQEESAHALNGASSGVLLTNDTEKTPLPISPAMSRFLAKLDLKS